MRRIRIAILLAAAVLLPVIHAQETPAPTGAAEWPTYNRDLLGTRHSPLAQITPANVSRLRQVWSYKLGKSPDSGGLTGGTEFTPIVVRGVMYAATATSVVALAPETGREIWKYDVPMGPPSKRGVGYWPGDGSSPARILFTSGRRLIALDAANGRPVAEFGASGFVDMTQVFNGSPTIYKNVILVGTNTPPGSVRGFNARTGAKVWEFRAVPQEAEAPGFETWENDGWKNQAGAISWAFSMTIDPQRNTLYAIFDSPTPDYYGGYRHGDNLFANSVVRGACGVLQGARTAQRWLLQRRSFHAVSIPRRRRSAALDDPVSGLGRWRQLGRHGIRPRTGLHLRQHDG